MAKTLKAVLKEHVNDELAKYVQWYMTPQDKRDAWDFKITEAQAEKDWLTRADVQDAMQAYVKYFKKQNLTQLYQSMYKKAMDGDVRAADWIVKFSDSAFFDESADEINDFLSGININGLGDKK